MTGLTEPEEEAGLLWKTCWKMMDAAVLGGELDWQEIDKSNRGSATCRQRFGSSNPIDR